MLRPSLFAYLKAALKPQIPRYAGVMALALFTAGCAVGPNFKTPAAPQNTGYTHQPLPVKTASANVHGGDAQTFIKKLDIPAQWWTLFGSKALNDLIAEAIKNNPDLDSARGALREAWENVYAQQGAFFPSIGVGYSATRQEVPGQLGVPTASGAYTYSLHTAQVTVGYAPDVFGGTRRQVESLVAQADSQRFELEAAYLTLTSNVVASAIQEAGLRAQIAETDKIIAIETHSLTLLQRQFALGQVAMADVVAQEAALANAKSSLPPLEKQLQLQRDLLARLAGRLPAQGLPGVFELSSLKLPRKLPLSLPSSLVEQRPDVRAAQAQMHAACAQVGVAIANRLPDITLSASLGSGAMEIAQLFSPGTGFWALAAGVTQPIFEGGQLLHKQRAARAAFQQAAAQYRSTVLTAFQNVADVLHAIQNDAVALKTAVEAERAASRSLVIARRQLELGDIGYLSLLNAEQTYQQAAINLAQALSNRYADTAALFQALGGGWWNRASRSAHSKA